MRSKGSSKNIENTRSYFTSKIFSTENFDNGNGFLKILCFELIMGENEVKTLYIAVSLCLEEL